jgi:hypothetical protein
MAGATGAALGGGWNQRWGCSLASVQKEEEGVGWAEWGEKAKRAGWLAGLKYEENFFSK